jgi:hypothetical protein
MDQPGWPAGLPSFLTQMNVELKHCTSASFIWKHHYSQNVLKISKTGHDMQVVFSQSYELFIWGKKRKKRHKRTLNWTLNCVVVKGFEHCHFDTRLLQNPEVLVLGLEVWRWSRVHLCEEHNSIWKEVQFDSHPSFHPWEKGVMD